MSEIVIMAPLRTNKGKGPELEKAFKEMVPLIKKGEKGTLEYALYRKEDDPDRFVVYEKYVDKAALAYHGSTPYFKEFGKKTAHLLVGPVQMDQIKFWVPVE